MIKLIPALLIFTRLLIGSVILALVNSVQADIWVIILMYAGILSDIFDGIIARKLNISTNNLRLLDTVVDLFFYLSIVVYIINRNPHVLTDHFTLIICLLTLEALMYIISITRFKKLPSPHAILSKFWGIYLVIEFTLVLLGVSGPHFRIALLFGLVAHLDRVLIYSFLRNWDHDIPSSYHALLIRQGKTIQRNKLFNG